MLSLQAACVSYFPSIVSCSSHLLRLKKKTNLTWKTCECECVCMGTITQGRNRTVRWRTEGELPSPLWRQFSFWAYTKFLFKTSNGAQIREDWGFWNNQEKKRRRETIRAINPSLLSRRCLTLAHYKSKTETMCNQIGGSASLSLHYRFILSFIFKDKHTQCSKWQKPFRLSIDF